MVWRPSRLRRVCRSRTMIYWVRHGQSTWNARGKMQGQALHPELTELGRRQAERAAYDLLDVGATGIISSPALRARQSAAIIAAVTALAVHVEDLVLEKGLDEDLAGLDRRLSAFLDRPAATIIVVSHGDVIALAMQRAGMASQVPENGSITMLN